VEVCWTSDSWAQKNLGSRGEKSRNSDKRALMGVECRFWGMSQPNLPNENTEEPSGYRERNGPLLTFHEGYLVDGDPNDLGVEKNSGREGKEGKESVGVVGVGGGERKLAGSSSSLWMWRS
jgi:hypothetical protein